MSWLRFRAGFCAVLLAISLTFLALGSAVPAASAAEPGPNARAIGRVMDVEDRHTPRLVALPGVVGTATGLDATGQPVVKVFLARAGGPPIPAKLDGETVVAEVTGEFFALPKPPGAGGGTGATIDPKTRFDRPVPIGVSTGNANECSAGTIGCRVVDGSGFVFALSNNHVYALENNAPINSDVLQPGRYDTNCVYDANNVIGHLFDFEPIVFSTSANNTVDAAIALSSINDLGNATPSNGYGTPKSVPVGPSIGQAVQKYGRTTALTKGTVIGINASVNVGYWSGTARFNYQIIVQARKPFIKAGDSGSLLVTDPGKNPVGLLFAGTSDGKTAIANDIGAVLYAFNVTIDGEP